MSYIHQIIDETTGRRLEVDAYEITDALEAAGYRILNQWQWQVARELDIDLFNEREAVDVALEDAEISFELAVAQHDRENKLETARLIRAELDRATDDFDPAFEAIQTEVEDNDTFNERDFLDKLVGIWRELRATLKD